MTTELTASRTLVKSPPELWAECSEADSLARHLGEFGEIRITRLEPETTVAWEGEHASGTVRIEPSGWGTRVTLTAQTEMEAPTEEPEEPPELAQEESDATSEETLEEPDPALVADVGPVRRRWRRVTMRVRGRFGAAEAVEAPEEVATIPEERAESIPPPEPVAAEPPEPPEDGSPAIDPEAILASALNSLGQAHHRPFSRA